MIKIKDYIFPEENILYIRQQTENTVTVLRKKPNEYDHFKDALEIKGTFEDIEWNYGNNISESLSYDLAKARIEELEEENKELKEEKEELKSGLDEQSNISALLARKIIKGEENE